MRIATSQKKQNKIKMERRTIANTTVDNRELQIVTMDGLTHDARKNHQQRKLEAKLLKRQKIEQSGGVRPRSNPSSSATKSNTNSSNHKNESPSNNESSNRVSNRSNERNTNAVTQNQQHRFGRVMEHVPCRNVSRFSTVSIAIPSSIMSNCQTRELKTILCGQIARAATIYHVDEIIIYNDNCNSNNQHHNNNNHFRHRMDRDKHNNKRSHDDHSKAETTKEENDNTTDSPSNDTKTNDRNASTQSYGTTDPQLFMARILQYCECPQYLRKHFFPLHVDLQYTGLLAPIDAPHHVRADDRCPYREGVVLNKSTPNNVVGSYVNCGIKNRPVLIEQRLQPGIRCTVQLDPSVYGRPGQIEGKVVSPSTVTHTDGTYWGYTVRIAKSMKAIFDECPYPESHYDLTIGTSERGNESIDDPNFSFQKRHVNKSSGSYRHALIVFGGVAGIEECIDADESILVSGSNCYTMFDKWINICPYQGSRTIRSEEAVLITLAKLNPFFINAAQTTSNSNKISNGTSSSNAEQSNETTNLLSFDKDEQLSDESSDEE